MKNFTFVIIALIFSFTAVGCKKTNCFVNEGGVVYPDRDCNGIPDYREQGNQQGGGVGTVPGGAPGGSTAVAPRYGFAIVKNPANSSSPAFNYTGSVGEYGCYEAEKYPNSNYVSEQYKSHAVEVITVAGTRIPTMSILNQDLLRDLKMDKATQDIATNLMRNFSNRTELEKMRNQYVWIAMVEETPFPTPQGASGVNQTTNCLSGSFFYYRTMSFEKKKIQDLFIW
jgi:hypothetical protein